MQPNFTFGPVKQTSSTSGLSGPVMTRTLVTPTDDSFLSKVTFDIDYTPGLLDIWLDGARTWNFEATDGETVTFPNPPFAGDFSGAIANPTPDQPFHEVIVFGNVINSIRIAYYLHYDFHDPGPTIPWDSAGPLDFDIDNPQIDRPFVQDVTTDGIAIDTGFYRDYGSYSWDGENQLVLFDPPLPHSSDRHVFISGYSVPEPVDPANYTAVDRGDNYSTIVFNPPLPSDAVVYIGSYLGTLEFNAYNPSYVTLINR